MVKGDLIPARGAIAEPVFMEVGRELTPGDLARLGEAPKVGPPALQRLRATHHRQALLLAQGKSVGEVAAIVGCTPQRLVQLQNDPTFSELLVYYQNQAIAALLEDTARLQAKIVDVGEMAVDELRDRMEDDGKRAAMRTDEVRKIAEFAMDRTVAPPKATQAANAAPANVTINFGTKVGGPTVEGKVTDVEE